MRAAGSIVLLVYGAVNMLIAGTGLASKPTTALVVAAISGVALVASWGLAWTSGGARER